MSARLSRDLKANQAALETLFRDCADIRFRSLSQADGAQGLLVYAQGLADVTQLTLGALLPLVVWSDPTEVAARITRAALPVGNVRFMNTRDQAANAVLDGDAVVLVDGFDQAVALTIEAGRQRAIEEPPAETVVRGPREGFNERIDTNIALVRRRLRTPDLKLKSFTIGRRTRTTVILAFVESIADPAPVAEAERRLRAIDIDGVLDSGYIEEFLEARPFSPFPEMQYSERPDTITAHLLEGRFAVFVDGTPAVLTGPITFWSMLQASEDYYERFIVATMLRWMRMLFLGLALFLPALYVAVTTFHQDMLPTNLLLSVASAREPIPFPALLEALLMEVSFEALREAGIRLPKTLGQTISVLGALVIGTAAVQAGIVSAPVVIIVSMTGIASFTIPRHNTAIGIRILRFPMMLVAGAFGLFGVIVGTVLLAVHLCNLESFGVPYLAPIAPLRPKDLGDVAVRAPWWAQGLRPSGPSGRNRRRLPGSGQPAPPQGGR
ncbi:MAG TPA: spore germination protein [Symbiobacteriaceae bacterium]|nr:spore germination protein [Symbiobacteriaceae bacterium]